jgi:hypothetical protein
MPNEVVNKEDLHDVRDTLSDQIQLGFGGITARLDVLNGRVGKGEISDAETRIRIENLEREVREKRSAQSVPVVGAAIEEQAAITRRDLKVAVAAIGAMYIVAQVLLKVVPWLAKLGG